MKDVHGKCPRFANRGSFSRGKQRETLRVESHHHTITATGTSSSLTSLDEGCFKSFVSFC